MLVAFRLVGVVVSGVVTVKPAFPEVVVAEAVWVHLIMAAASLPSVGVWRKSLDKLRLGGGN